MSRYAAERAIIESDIRENFREISQVYRLTQTRRECIILAYIGDHREVEFPNGNTVVVHKSQLELAQ